MASGPITDFQAQSFIQSLADTVEKQTRQLEDGVHRMDGGITDSPMAPEGVGRCAIADNIVSDTSGRPTLHHGSRLAAYESAGVAVPNGLGRSITALIPFGSDKILIIKDGELKYYNMSRDNIQIGSFMPLLPQGVAEPIFTPSAKNYTWARIHNEVVICSGEWDRPLLVYKVSDSDFEAHWLALPQPPEFRVVQLDEDGEVLTGGEVGATVTYRALFVRKYTSSGFNKEDIGSTFGVAVERYRAAASIRLDILRSETSPLYGGLEVELYRTSVEETSQDSYLLGRLRWDGEAVSYTDELEDIRGNKRLYTETAQGIVPENAPPPRAKFVAEAGGRILLGNIQLESGETQDNRVVYSKEGVPYAFPPVGAVDVNYTVTGLGAFRNNGLIFTRFSVHRLDRSPRQVGLDAFEIENDRGSESARSLVQTDMGLFYLGPDGFYKTDGLSCMKLSDHINDFVREVKERVNVFGVYNPLDFKIYWFYRHISSRRGADQAFVLSLLHTREGRSGGHFTKFVLDPCEDEAITANIRTSSVIWFRNRLWRANLDGTLSYSKMGYYNDDILDRRPGVGDIVGGLDGNNVRRVPLYFDFRSRGLDFGARGAIKDLGRVTFSVRPENSFYTGSLNFYGVPDGKGLFPFSDVTFPASTDGRNAVTTEKRPMHSSFRNVDFYQLGVRNGLVLEHTFDFSYDKDSGVVTLGDITPALTGNTRRYPFVSFKFYITTVDDETLSKALEGQFICIAPDPRNTATQLKIGGSILNRLKVFSLEGSHANFTGRGQLFRPTALGFELLVAKVEGKLGGKGLKVAGGKK